VPVMNTQAVTDCAKERLQRPRSSLAREAQAAYYSSRQLDRWLLGPERDEDEMSRAHTIR
jgi:hypothetical protein